MRKIAQKFAKKICAKIAQILRKKFSHFVETLSPISHKSFYIFLVWQEVFDNGVQVKDDTIINVWKVSVKF